MTKSIEMIMQEEAPEFVAEVANLTGDQLNLRLAKFAKYDEENEDARRADEGLRIARDQVKLYDGPYADTKKMIRKKMRYLIYLLKSRGTTKE